MAATAYDARPPSPLYAAADHRRNESLFAVQKCFLRLISSIWPKLPVWLPAKLGFVLHVRALLVVAVSGHLGLLFTKTTFDELQAGSLEDITDALTMAIIYSFTCFAVCYWLWHSTRLERFLQRIDREHRHHSLAGLTFVSSHRSYVLARRLTFSWLLCCYSGVMLWGFAPIILRSHALPLRCWYPFDAMQNGVYEVVYVTQLLGQAIVGTTYGSGSALFVSLVILMLGQFDVLFCSLKNFEYHARLLSGADLHELRKLQLNLLGLDDELNQYIYSEEHITDLTVFKDLPRSRKVCRNAASSSYEQQLHEALVDCVHHHRFIMECCKELEDLYSPYCLVKSLQITVQLCLLVFVGVAGEQTTMRVINLLQYVSLTAVELLMFTYFGELLSSHSVRSGDALWRASWWRNATYIRNDIIIFLLNSSRAVKLTAGKFYAMDVERFRSVVMQAFSFLTLLQNLAAKNTK